MLDTKEIMREWSQQSAYIRKPKLGEACSVIESLCVEVNRLRKEVEEGKRAADSYDAKIDQLMVDLDLFLRKHKISNK